jgi:hypothetical protein
MMSLNPGLGISATGSTERSQSQSTLHYFTTSAFSRAASWAAARAFVLDQRTETEHRNAVTQAVARATRQTVCFAQNARTGTTNGPRGKPRLPSEASRIPGAAPRATKLHSSTSRQLTIANLSILELNAIELTRGVNRRQRKNAKMRGNSYFSAFSMHSTRSDSRCDRRHLGEWASWRK